ncbi:MAG TPA: hypothetical protein VLU98_02175, partial [Methanomicrobiales archaeon]|nr:hypothetical protein [Methanomicrobiales archaeon]
MIDLIERFADLPVLGDSQQENLRGLVEVSRAFSSDAGIPQAPEVGIGSGTVVLESGHQPNFLPYSGVWKKAFLLDSLRRELAAGGRDAVALFGFSDHILSTASYLSQNQVPAYRKPGKENIGFRIPEKDRWKCFHVLGKPPEDQLRREIDKIRRIYAENTGQVKPADPSVQHRLDRVLGTLAECHGRSRSFADWNAFFFSRLCTEVFGLRLHFFRYSDVFGRGLLLEESRRILSRPRDFSSHLRDAMVRAGTGAPVNADDELPFWYHCECGGKLHLTGTGPEDLHGTCPVCGRDHHVSFGRDLGSLGASYPRMSPNAIARNLIFSEGFGTGLFISGTGGGLRYGRVADAVSEGMGFRRPVTLAWRSADLYLGAVQNRAILELMKTFRLDLQDLRDGQVNRKIGECRGALERKMKELEGQPVDKKAIQKYRGRYLNSQVQAETVRNVFSGTPSFLDV